jgi:iron(III) transport system ATP-binding protein
LREELRFELKELQAKLAVTSIYVTHDQTEAMVMADRVAVMRSGRIEQLASPKVIYERPTTRFVSSFIGQTNLFRGEIRSDTARDGLVEVFTELGIGLRVAADGSAGKGPRVRIVGVSIRPENIALSRVPLDTSINQFKGKVAQKFSMGSHMDYRIGIGAHSLRVHTHPDQDFAVGDEVFVCLAPSKCHCMNEQDTSFM